MIKQQTTHYRLLLALLIAALLGVGAVFAQTGGGYDLTWSTIDGGGGSSTAGGYQLSGTFGQPDAWSASNGGEYSLSAGFWSGASPGNTVYLPLVVRN